jgi:hypothetical protein
VSLNCTIDREQKIVTVTAEGDVTRADFETVLDTIDAADAHGYRKLFDGGRGETRMTADDALALGVRMRARHASGPMGPLAVVMPEKYVELAARALGMLAAADRPMRVFADVKRARRWLRTKAAHAAIHWPGREHGAAPSPVSGDC